MLIHGHLGCFVKFAKIALITNLTQQLTADNGQTFQYGYDSTSGKYGYYVKEAGTDVFVPFSSGARDSLIVCGLSGSAVAIVTDNGAETVYTSQTRDTLIALINNGGVPFMSNASAMSGTSGIIIATFTRGGYYMIGFEQTGAHGGIFHVEENQQMRLGWTDDFFIYLGDTNPFT